MGETHETQQNELPISSPDGSGAATTAAIQSPSSVAEEDAKNWPSLSSDQDSCTGTDQQQQGQECALAVAGEATAGGGKGDDCSQVYSYYVY